MWTLPSQAVFIASKHPLPKTIIDRLIDDGYKECSEQLASTVSRTK